jgi:hypothetical protein
MPTYERPLRGWRWSGGKKVRMTPLEELRWIAKGAVRPGESAETRERGRWAIAQIKEKYPGKGIFKPKEWEEE